MWLELEYHSQESGKTTPPTISSSKKMTELLDCFMDAMIENDRGILYMHQEDLENALLCFQEGLQLVRMLQRTSCANKRHLPRNSKFIIPLVSDENGEMKSNLSSNDASYHVFPYPIALQSCQIESFAQGDVIPCIDRLSGVLKFNFWVMSSARRDSTRSRSCYWLLSRGIRVVPDELQPNNHYKQSISSWVRSHDMSQQCRLCPFPIFLPRFGKRMLCRAARPTDWKASATRMLHFCCQYPNL